MKQQAERNREEEMELEDTIEKKEAQEVTAGHHKDILKKTNGMPAKSEGLISAPGSLVRAVLS